MPGDHQRELEPTLMRAHKSLPRARLDIFPAAQAVPLPSSSDLASIQSKPRGHTTSSLGSPIVLNGDSALPPTPPSNSRDFSNRYHHAHRPPLVANSMASLAQKTSGLSTPTNGRSPPTPDTTPPNASALQLRDLAPSPLASFVSRTESFQTAREEQWSSDDEPDSLYTHRPGLQTSTSTYAEATKALRCGGRGLGFDYARDEQDATPTPDSMGRAVKQEPAAPATLRDKSNHGVNSGLFPEDSGAWNGSTMRNVTPRSRHCPRTPPGQQEHHAQKRPVKPVELPQKIGERRVVSSPMATPMSRVPPAVVQPINGSAHELDAKRLSGVSSASTIVEAFIRVSTPPKPSTLRHVKKYSGLRSFSGSLIDISASPTVTIPSATKTSTSDGTVSRRLSHKRGSIGEKRYRSSLPEAPGDGDNVSRPSELKRPLKHRDYSRVRFEDFFNRLPSNLSQLRPLTASLSSSDLHADPSPQKSDKTSEFEASPNASQLTGSTNLEANAAPQSKPSTPPSSSPTTTSSPTENATRISPKVPQMVKPAFKLAVHRKRASQPQPGPQCESKPEEHSGPKSKLGADNEPDEGPPPERNSSLKRTGRKLDNLDLPPFPTTSNSPSSRPDRAASSSSLESKSKLLPMIPTGAQTRARSIPRNRLTSDASDADDVRRVSFESRSASNDNHDYPPRKSADSRRSTFNVLERPHGLYPPVTPLSMSSMRSEAAELSEATAVNFYPHTNQSVVLVQHRALEPQSYASHSKDDDRLEEAAAHPMADCFHQDIETFSSPVPGQSPSPPTEQVLPPSNTLETESILHISPPVSAHSIQAPRLFDQPQLRVEPCTPPPQIVSAEQDNVDSPLRNPRQPPVPPAVKVIPATPFQDRESPLDAAGAEVASRPPVSRLGLVKKARRYSDSILGPFVDRASVLKRGSGSSSKRPSYAEQKTSRDKDSTLHPFWRPRGFWDDFSDSDSDEFWGDGEPLDADESVEYRLPEGGDTSDVRSLEQERGKLGRIGSVKRVVGGFVNKRNSSGGGGFLIGNSLGLERGPTNKRRHVVRLPARLQVRFTQPQISRPIPISESISAPATSYGASGSGSGGFASTPASTLSAQSRPAPPSHVNDVQNSNKRGPASLPASLAPGHNPLSLLSPPSGFAHNTTSPLPPRSSSQSPAYSNNISISSFPSSSYLSTAGSARGRGLRRRHSSWKRKVRFPSWIEYVGLRGMVENMKEQRAEKRRRELKGAIGVPREVIGT